MNEGQDMSAKVTINTFIFKDGTRVVGFEVIPGNLTSAEDLLKGLFWDQTFRVGFAGAVANCEWWNEYEKFMWGDHPNAPQVIHR